MQTTYLINHGIIKSRQELIDIQAKQLAEWQRVLKPEYFEKLKCQVEYETSEEYVIRGNDILNIIDNLVFD